MKIVIVSDTHDNWPNFEKVIKWAMQEKISLILHCGDICSQEIIDKAKAAFAKASASQVKFAQGNADKGAGLDLPVKMELEVSKKKIGFCHFPDIAKKMAQSGKYDIVFYGHTHRAWDEMVENTHMVNPGESAGQFYKPTFAVYDIANGKLELKILEKI
jgi:putative phosphoesterase